RVAVTGRAADKGGKRVLRGRIEGADYHLVRAPALARVLSLASLPAVASMLKGTGIPFSTLRGEFAYGNGRLLVEQLLAYGGAIGATANGEIDIDRDRLDLQGTIVPAYTLNSILGNIPVIGSLLLGGEGQGLFAANYRLTGSSADPEISVNPLSALAPGFLRRLFQPNFGMPPGVQESLGQE
ncbi:MAG TPA: AsmA-like C-terminal domain-containing protein, partial [Stellaceae bacterium]|nr:AsmA-like C-terminal domain-containing protein [Stellaceae bacterium]